MKKFKDFLGRPVVTAVLFALAVLLLAGSTVGGARAALNIESQYYNSEIEVLDIGVALVEMNVKNNYVPVSGKNGLMGKDTPIAKEVQSDKKLLVGKKYPESLAVRNTGDINEYVRVAVYKYWLDENGNKFADMDSGWIKLGFVTGGKWSIDTESTTEERTVLYYSEAIAPGTDTTPFMDSIIIDELATKRITKTETTVGNVTSVTWTYDYNGKQFCIEVHVDSVQDHNAADAKISAWGVNK